jgi:hypothetical protein
VKNVFNEDLIVPVRAGKNAAGTFIVCRSRLSPPRYGIKELRTAVE